MQSRRTNNFPWKWAWPRSRDPYNFGSTVGYPSDSLASCLTFDTFSAFSTFDGFSTFNACFTYQLSTYFNANFNFRRLFWLPTLFKLWTLLLTLYVCFTYTVGQIKWYHFTFLLVTHECIQKILWFLAYKLHNAENETMLSLCHYVNSCSPEGATNMSTFYLHYSSFTSS